MNKKRKQTGNWLSEGAIDLGRKGGLAYSKNHTPEQRSEHALAAATARWRNHSNPTSRWYRNKRNAAPQNAKLTGVYFLWRADKIVYVGQARDILSRIRQHLCEGKRFDCVSWQVVLHPVRRNELEAELIAALKPSYNVLLKS